MNKDNCLEVLLDHLPKSFDRCSVFFMQDTALSHTATQVTGWLSDREIDFFSDWSGNFSDLIPKKTFEHYWGWRGGGGLKLYCCNILTIIMVKDSA